MVLWHFYLLIEIKLKAITESQKGFTKKKSTSKSEITKMPEIDNKNRKTIEIAQRDNIQS